MTQPAEPANEWRARDLYQQFVHSSAHDVPTMARALTDAEARGAKAEREACARMAEEWLNGSPSEIAHAIRRRGGTP